MAETRTVYECLFCPQTFDSAAVKDDHTLHHFAQEICMDCNQNLIRIGEHLYTPHDETTCIKRELKLERNDRTAFINQNVSESICDGNNIGTIFPTPTICVEEVLIKPEPITNLDQQDAHEDLDCLEEANEPLSEPVATDSQKVETEFFQRNGKSLAENLLSVELQVKSGSVENPEEHDVFADETQSNDPSRQSNSRPNRKRKIAGETSECDICGKVMLTPSLYYHMRNVHSTPGTSGSEFKCEPCRKRFKTADILRKHMRMKHDPTVKKLKCELCCLIFMKESSLRNHHCKRKFGEIFRSEPMPCDVCGKMLSNKNSLRKHKTLLHSPMGTIFCNVCGRLFASAVDRDEHKSECYRRQKIRNAEFFKATQSRRKEIKYEGIDDTQLKLDESHGNRRKPTSNDHSQCNVCGKYLLTASLYNHMKHVHSTPGPSKPFRCDICKINFKTEENHRKHMRMKHDPSIKKFKCELCCRIFVKESSLETHNCSRKLGEAIKKIPMPCEICGRVLSSRGALQKHQVLLHSPPETIFCNVCGRKFGDADDRDAHREECALKSQIRKSKAFSELGCFICNIMFKSNDLLRNHIEMKHQGCEKFECNLCQIVFMKDNSFRNHICKPKRENGVSCEVCGKDLATRRSLRVHMILVHSPPDSIFCNLCGRKCVSIEERDGHKMECALKKKILNAKRQSTRLECEVCRAVFKDKSRIRHHMQQIHNINMK